MRGAISSPSTFMRLIAERCHASSETVQPATACTKVHARTIVARSKTTKTELETHCASATDGAQKSTATATTHQQRDQHASNGRAATNWTLTWRCIVNSDRICNLSRDAQRFQNFGRVFNIHNANSLGKSVRVAVHEARRRATTQTKDRSVCRSADRRRGALISNNGVRE